MDDFQVQLLVSDSDVENYKQIKSDLDELRLLVEKSELWVYKKKSEGKKEKKKTEEDEAPSDKVDLISGCKAWPTVIVSVATEMQYPNMHLFSVTLLYADQFNLLWLWRQVKVSYNKFSISNERTWRV